jgi:thiamine phosphate synthase YjbQ (UPF0047 family)
MVGFSFYGSLILSSDTSKPVFTGQVIIRNGKMWLGTWRGIYFCEFDGSRERKVQLALTS